MNRRDIRSSYLQCFRGTNVQGFPVRPAHTLASYLGQPNLSCRVGAHDSDGSSRITRATCASYPHDHGWLYVSQAASTYEDRLLGASAPGSRAYQRMKSRMTPDPVETRIGSPYDADQGIRPRPTYGRGQKSTSLVLPTYSRGYHPPRQSVTCVRKPLLQPAEVRVSADVLERCVRRLRQPEQTHCECPARHLAAEEQIGAALMNGRP